MAWSLVSTGSTVWSSTTTGGGGEFHPLGSPIGLLLVLTYPTAGDDTWNQNYDNSTTWTLVSSGA